MTNQTLRDQLLAAIREQIGNLPDQQKPSDQGTSPTPRTLREVVDEMGANAEKRGLTPELLDSLLRNE
jgi:hypothetical protein